VTNYIRLRSEWFWTAYHSPSGNKKNPNPWELWSDRYPRHAGDSGWILCTHISPVFTSLFTPKISIFLFWLFIPYAPQKSELSLKVEGVTLQHSVCNRWMKPWSCDRLGTAGRQATIYAKVLFLCQASLMSVDFSGVCKHSACQKYQEVSKLANYKICCYYDGCGFL